MAMICLCRSCFYLHRIAVWVHHAPSYSRGMYGTMPCDNDDGIACGYDSGQTVELGGGRDPCSSWRLIG